MDTFEAIAALSALAQETRLNVYRLLVRSGESGLIVGEIAERLKLAPATLSFHLKELVHARLIRTEQRGRMVHCTVNFSGMTALMAFLHENCCVEQAPLSQGNEQSQQKGQALSDCCPSPARQA